MLDCAKGRTFRTRFPTTSNGAWNGIGKYTTAWWRRHRAAVRDALSHGNEPPLPKHKHSCKWEVW